MRKLVFVFAFILALSACMPSVHVMRYTTALFPPSSNVEILRTKPADREYIEIGEVSIRLKEGALYQRLRDNAVLMLAEKAKELGADALILIGERQRGATYVPVGRSVVGVNKQDLVGVAIKYKQPEHLR